MTTRSVYLDYNATAPLCSEASEAMRPWLEAVPANPSAVHRSGQQARAALEQARAQVAAVCGAGSDVVFTGGGTEADNLAVWGLLGWPPSGELVVSAVEHPAILEPAAALAELGVGVALVGVDSDGRIDLGELEGALTDRTRLVSVMAANNEVGTLQPIARIVELAHDRGIPVHCDAVQALAWLPLLEHVGEADMLTLAAHKIGGPVGIGALVLRRPTELEPLLRGGGQQRGRRPGTETTALACGFAAACTRVADRGAAERIRVGELVAHLSEVLRAVPGVHATVGAAQLLPNTLHLCIDGLDSTALVARLDLEGVAASGGSACASGVTHASHVLEAMGIPDARARGALRLSLGYDTTAAEVEFAAGRIAEAIEAVRGSHQGSSGS
jgi:cysteine desulfurase